MNTAENIIGFERPEDRNREGKITSLRNPVSSIFFRYLFLLLFYLTLVPGPGCSPVSVKTPPEDGKKRACDLRADTAMRLEAYDTSIKLHAQFIEREPENELALYHLGFSYGQVGNHENEVHYYEKAIALGFKEEQIFFNLGMALGEVNQLEKAILAFKEGLALNPGSADNYFGLGLTYQKIGRNQAAEGALKNAIEIDPENLDARFYLSLLYADIGNFEKSRRQLQQILEIDPSYMSARDLLDRIEEEGEE